ncbi:nucleotidyltransferase family protein [Alicyclobacillus ferrooxydans]|uniref:Nucleotidyltransferase family protein n=1 Tax=Alicyclobacillus ferrooxydans TaxID=471514 RepID=A0A0P9EUA5_9BACL|nr:nucleotidyltransferase family protein [Alicyclobacillus ferrooxydans]KPV42531.1 hypothetical protein AN477_16945 [Alicyclobacillus ferrooxydans]
MLISTEKDVLHLIKDDQLVMTVIRAAKTLGLPDWWICAGFVRSKVWDTLQGFTSRTEVPDVDVIYFNPESVNESEEKQYEAKLRNIVPVVPWSVKNEARMHLVNDIPPYSSAVDAISKFPETVTSLGVKLNDDDELVLIAPHGVEDLFNFHVRPTPYFEETIERAQIYETRLLKKNWGATWDKVSVTHTTLLLR